MMGFTKKLFRDSLFLTLVVVLFLKDSVHGSVQAIQHSVHSTSDEKSIAGKGPEIDSFADVLDRSTGAEFVELFDPLMDGRISEIMDRLRHKYPEYVWQKILRLPARNFLQILDGLSGGRLSVLIYAYANPNRARRAPLDTMSGMSLGGSKRSSGLDPMAGLSFGAPTKRNFDEMDRSGFSGFAKRFSDFDEIDRAGFSGFAKRRTSDFDEMDRAGFSGFAKRLSDFDEIDRAGFSGFAKRSNFDELDRVGFNGFAKRADNRNNPLVSMMRANSMKNQHSGSENGENNAKTIISQSSETAKN